ncbi:unnamed protein product, partial [Urochloa humidicola]
MASGIDMPGRAISQKRAAGVPEAWGRACTIETQLVIIKIRSANNGGSMTEYMEPIGTELEGIWTSGGYILIKAFGIDHLLLVQNVPVPVM